MESTQQRRRLRYSPLLQLSTQERSRVRCRYPKNSGVVEPALDCADIFTGAICDPAYVRLRWDDFSTGTSIICCSAWVCFRPDSASKCASQQLVIFPRRPALDARSAKARHHRQVLDLLLFEGL
jgi:hypothetical protein